MIKLGSQRTQRNHEEHEVLKINRNFLCVLCVYLVPFVLLLTFETTSGVRSMERITATYYIETPFAPERAAAVLAGEQSSGTFVAVPGETEELKQRFAASVESIELLETVNEPAIPGAISKNGKYHRAIVKVSWSIENFGYNLPVMVSTLQGNLYEITQFTGLKLMDIDLPASF